MKRSNPILVTNRLKIDPAEARTAIRIKDSSIQVLILLRVKSLTCPTENLPNGQVSCILQFLRIPQTEKSKYVQFAYTYQVHIHTYD